MCQLIIWWHFNIVGNRLEITQNVHHITWYIASYCCGKYFVTNKQTHLWWAKCQIIRDSKVFYQNTWCLFPLKLGTLEFKVFRLKTWFNDRYANFLSIIQVFRLKAWFLYQTNLIRVSQVFRSKNLDFLFIWHFTCHTHHIRLYFAVFYWIIRCPSTYIS